MVSNRFLAWEASTAGPGLPAAANPLGCRTGWAAGGQWRRLLLVYTLGEEVTVAFLRPSPLPTHVQMGSPTQVPGSKGTSTGPAAGKTQGQRRFLWQAQSFSPGLRLSAGQSPDPRPLPGADQVTQDVCDQSPSGKRELPARFSLCPSEARGLEPPPSTASPPPRFPGEPLQPRGQQMATLGGCLLLPVSRPGTKGRKRDGEWVVSGDRGLSKALPWGRGRGTARGQNMAAA